MRYLKHAMALSLASALAACGGGGDENETVAATFQTNVVNVSSQTVKAGNIINGDATTTFDESDEIVELLLADEDVLSTIINHAREQAFTFKRLNAINNIQHFQ